MTSRLIGRHITRCVWSVSLALSSGLLGCAASTARFPSRAEIHNIGDAPPPSRFARLDVVEVDTWKLEGPLPQVVGNEPHPASSPWDALLARVAQKRSGLVALTEPMHCMAREMGRFYMAKNGLPPDDLERFIAARCGVVGSGVSTWYQKGEVSEGTTVEQLHERWGSQVETAIAEQLGTGVRAAGLWAGVAGRHAVVVGISVIREIALEPLALVPDASGAVILKGEVLSPSENVTALVNKGRFGFAPCDPSPQAKLPRFELRCTPDKTDVSAWIELGTFPPGRVIGTTALTMLAWPAGEPGDTYARPAPEDVAPGGAAGGDTVRSFHDAINRVRAAASLSAVALAPAQTETARRVAPHFFAALFGLKPEILADKMALGLRAGWDVDGRISHGLITWGVVRNGPDVERLVASLLARPSGREALLDPAAARLAVGAVASPEDRVLAAVLCTYALFDPKEQAAAPEKILRRLTELRQKAGRRAPQRLQGLEGFIQSAIVQVGQRKDTPTEALDSLLQAAVEQTQRPARGWVSEASRIEELVYPPEILSEAALDVALGVAYYVPENEPWGRWVVFFVAVEGGVVASAGGPTRIW